MKKFITLTLSLSMILSLGIAAFATEYTSNVKTINADVATYEAWSSLYLDGDNEARAATWIEADSALPANYMSVKAVLYDEDDVVKATTQYVSNYSNAYFTFIDTDAKKVTDSKVHSQGQVKVYYDDDNVAQSYTLSATGEYATRSMNNDTVLNDYTSYDVLENGDTYGSGLKANTLGYMPDLIETVGDSGKVGYIKLTDIDSMPVLENIPGEYSYSISVYDLEGTAIDTFTSVTIIYEVSPDMSAEEAQAMIANGTY